MARTWTSAGCPAGCHRPPAALLVVVDVVPVTTEPIQMGCTGGQQSPQGRRRRRFNWPELLKEGLSACLFLIPARDNAPWLRACPLARVVVVPQGTPRACGSRRA
jgi:hypothetical protein